MARIQKLDEVVVNRIAAGEILHRPANAIKEMIENSIDAKATSIQITVKDGGMKLLQIQDNGHGILKEDLGIVCERFTTSKLRKFEDLNSIATFGFRGEALASISHVAHVAITTKTAESSCAWKATYKDGKLLGEPKACAGTTGTIISVEDLFYNVATRRKALNNVAEEYNRVLDIVNRYAVHNTGVAFHLKKHGATVADVSTSSSSSQVDVIRTLYGGNVARELLPFEYTSPSLQFKASALLTNANFNVKKFTFLLFINQRAVDNPKLKRAIEAVYATYLPKGTHSFVYLALNIAPQHVDVNVHPTKQEVHFLNEDAIIDQVCTSIQEKLLNANSSRTFFTQALLPGVAPPAAPPTASASSATSPQQQQQSYAHERVRTDNRTRSIDAFVTREKAPRSADDDPVPAPSGKRARRNDDDDDDVVDDVALAPSPLQNNQPTPEQRQPKEVEPAQPQERVDVQLTSVLELRLAIVAGQHQGIQSIVRDHYFVGCVNDYLALIQFQTKLYIVNYRELSRDLFYQLALREFNNFGKIVLSKPVSITDLVRIALDMDEAGWTEDDGPKEHLAEAVVRVVTKRKDLLLEYFSLEVDAEGQLLSLPVILKGYLPNLDNLPMFLLRLGSEIDWSVEKTCLDGICQQLAWFYGMTAPHALASDPADIQQQSGQEFRWQVEHVLFPALRFYLVPDKKLADSGSIIQVADLPDLYKVFERC